MYSLIFLKNDLFIPFYGYVLLACMYMYYMCGCCQQRLEEVPGSPGTGIMNGLTAIWVLGIESGSSSRATRAPHCWVTSPVYTQVLINISVSIVVWLVVWGTARLYDKSMCNFIGCQNCSTMTLFPHCCLRLLLYMSISTHCHCFSVCSYV